MNSKYHLFYTEQGVGRAMVLLHGNGEDSSYFKEQIAYFSNTYRVIAVDTRGHGKSGRGEAAFTLKQFAKDLKQLLDRKHIKDIILLGFSDGGNIALIFALMYPEYVERLILNGANLNPFGMKTGLCLTTLLEYGAASAAALFCRKAVRRKELLGLMAKEPWIAGRHLRRLRVPTLVIAGTKDMIRERHTRRIHRLIPGSRLVILNGSHFIAAENSGEFNRAVEHFLDSTAEIGPVKPDKRQS